MNLAMYIPQRHLRLRSIELHHKPQASFLVLVVITLSCQALGDVF